MHHIYLGRSEKSYQHRLHLRETYFNIKHYAKYLKYTTQHFSHSPVTIWHNICLWLSASITKLCFTISNSNVLLGLVRVRVDSWGVGLTVLGTCALVGILYANYWEMNVWLGMYGVWWGKDSIETVPNWVRIVPRAPNMWGRWDEGEPMSIHWDVH